MNTPKLIAYYRVSTARQGRSGLGLEAQGAAVEAYRASVGGEILASFTEVESGKRSDRPQLAEALRLADVTGATLVIAKLDRLSRNAAFLLTLRDSGVRFIAADMPEASNLTVGVLAVVAQDELERVSRRTREALAEAKKRGKVLGNPNGAAALRRAGKGNAAAVEAAATKAADHAAKVLPIVGQIRGAGVDSLGGIAAELNRRGVRTVHGGQWYRSSVRGLLARQSECAV